MIRLHSSISLRLPSFQIMALLMISVGQVFAVQITPNPNPEGNTIIIAPPTPAENLVPFTNLGVINIQAAASFQNANRFENSGGVISAGRVTKGIQGDLSSRSVRRNDTVHLYSLRVHLTDSNSPGLGSTGGTAT